MSQYATTRRPLSAIIPLSLAADRRLFLRSQDLAINTVSSERAMSPTKEPKKTVTPLTGSTAAVVFIVL